MNSIRCSAVLLLTAGSLACNQGEKREFLDPQLPTNPSILARVFVTGQVNGLVTEQMTRFVAYGRTNSGDSVPVQVTWRATGGVINSDGYFVADQAGSYTVAAVAISRPELADSMPFEVARRPPRLVAVLVDPSPVSLPEGDTQAFTATSYFDDGSVREAPVDWQTTGGLIDSQGVYVAEAPAGDYQIEARSRGSDGIFGRTRVKVTRRETVTSFQISPATVTLAPGHAVTFSGVQTFDDGSVASPAVAWSAHGGTISNLGRYTAGAIAGSFRVIGKVIGGVRADTADVLIQAAPIVSVSVSPGSATLAPGGSIRFSASGLDADGNVRVAGVTWTATGGSINASGDYSAGSQAGTFKVIARLQGGLLADTSVITITSGAPSILSLSTSPAAASVPAGTTKQFAVLAQWSDGSTAVPPVIWSATGGSISASGLYTAGTASGSFRVVARHSGGKADTSSVTVTAPTTTSISVTPKSAAVNVGSTQQFSAAVTLSTGTQSAAAVAWSATGGTIAPSGLYSAGAIPGSYLVIASQGAVAETVSVVVQPAAPTLLKMSVSPKAIDVAASANKQFAVTGTWSNGTTGAPPVTWSATGGTISSGGLFSAGSVGGNYRVIAKYTGGNIADTASVTVTAPTLTALSVMPKTLAIGAGGTQVFTALGQMSDGSNLTPSVSWTALGGTISATGTFTAGPVAGAYRVIARQIGGTLADTASVTISVQAPTLTAIAVTPASVNLVAGGARQFAVSGTLSNGSTTTPAVTWSATGGSISSSGLFTAGNSAGNYTVVAKLQGGTLADTAVVTVTAAAAPTLVSVRVSPSAASLPPAGKQQFAAVGVYSDGSTQTATVNWTAQGGTISGAGLFTAGTAGGNYRIIAVLAAGTKADTATVSVVVPGQFPAQYDPSRLGGALVAGESWQDLVVGTDNGYSSALAKGWRQSAAPYPKPEPGQLSVEPDALFGQVVRFVQPDYHLNKFYGGTVEKIISTPNLSHFWYRATVRLRGGNGRPFTTDGTGLVGGSTTWKMFFAFPYDAKSRMEVVQHKNGRLLLGFAHLEPTRVETALVQTAATPCPSQQLYTDVNGTDMRSNEDWYEIILNYEEESPSQYIQRYFMRRLTVNGVWSPWSCPVWSGSRTTSGTAKDYNRFHLGGNKSQTFDGPGDQLVFWGPWEITTAADPYGLAKFGK